MYKKVTDYPGKLKGRMKITEEPFRTAGPQTEIWNRSHPDIKQFQTDNKVQ
jgi:hypothetical protein